jgi:hypothetical protein
MAIKLACPGCGKKLRAKDKHAGRRTKCPACGRAIEVPVPATPNGQTTPSPIRQRPAAAQDVARIGAGTDDGDEEYVSPPFRSPGSSPSGGSPPGHRVSRRTRGERGGSPRQRGSARDPWYDLLARPLGLASMGLGGAILLVGLPASREWGRGGSGAILVVACSLTALVAGVGTLLLADVARSLRRLSRGADRDAGGANNGRG